MSARAGEKRRTSSLCGYLGKLWKKACAAAALKIALFTGRKKRKRNHDNWLCRNFVYIDLLMGKLALFRKKILDVLARD